MCVLTGYVAMQREIDIRRSDMYAEPANRVECIAVKADTQTTWGQA